MSDHNDDVPPLDPVKVAVFVLLLGGIAFAGWRFYRAQSAVAAVAEASKDYRKLFPARGAETPAPPPKPMVAAQAPVSGMGLLKIDDEMRAPKPAPAEEPPPPAAPAEEAPPPPRAAAPAAPAKPARKAFNQPRLNSGAFSGLNGGSGVGLSGGSLGGGGGAAPSPAAPVLPDIPGLPAAGKK
jgi:translation initiation factor IF-2